MKTFNDLENDLKMGKTYFTSTELMIKNKNGITFLECLLMTDYKDKFTMVDYNQEIVPILCRYKSRLLLNIPIDYRTLFVKYYKDRTVLDYIKSTNYHKYKLNFNFPNIVYGMEDIYDIKKSSGALITRFKIVYRRIDPVIRKALENTFRYLNSVNKEESLKYIKALIDLKLKHKDFNIVYNPNGKSCFNRAKNTIYLNNLSNIYTIVHETMHAIHYNNLDYDIPKEYYDYQEEIINSDSFIPAYNEKRKLNKRMHGEITIKPKKKYSEMINSKFKDNDEKNNGFEKNVRKMIKGILDKDLFKYFDIDFLVEQYIKNNRNDFFNGFLDMYPLFEALLLIDDITEGNFNDDYLNSGGHKKGYFKNGNSFYEFFADYGTIRLLGTSNEVFSYFSEMTGLSIDALMDDFYNMAIIGENKGKIRKKV